MMRDELESRLGGNISDLDWPVLQHIYNYHPAIPDVGGKDVFAQKILAVQWNGATVEQKAHAIIPQMLAQANDVAEKAGHSRMTYRTQAWYGQEEWNDECRHVASHNKTIGEIGAWLSETLHAEGLIDEYFSDMTRYEPPKDRLWLERYRWIAVFPVTGGSEGHYVHVEIISAADDKRELIFLAKTFKGMDHARTICARVQDLLGV